VGATRGRCPHNFLAVGVIAPIESAPMNDRKSLGVEAKVLGTFVPGSESSRDRTLLGAKVLGTFAPGSESSRERKFLGAISESSIPWYFRSRERKFHNSRLLPHWPPLWTAYVNRFLIAEILEKLAM